ncbi:MAG: response regulator [Labilithrix sp.]
MSDESEKGRVWVLEDSPLEAEMARRALVLQDVTLFEDGSVVLERIAVEARPDVLVLDTQLVGLSGLDVCRAVRERYGANELPVLMVTAQSGQADVLEALHAGANDYVIKPYHVAELAARVATLVRTSRLVAAQAVRARQTALAADVGAALTEGRTTADVARRAAEAIAKGLAPCTVEIWVKSGGALLRSARAGLDQELPESSRVPLVVRDEVIGAVAVSPAHDSLATVASLLALGLARARAEEERLVLLDRERNARAEAEAANRSKDDFLAMVSHELRTPLNAITGWTSMLLSGGLDPVRTKRAYETIDRNARSQAQLIDDLLDIGRITSGTLRLNESQIEVGSIAEMALESLRPTADVRGVQLDANIGPDLGATKGDAQRIQQVIWNLLSNSIKFTPRGGVVQLLVNREPTAIIIEVTDSGQGIAPEFLPRVFDRFRQQDGSSTRARGGLGLGLSIVRHLVELHGGTISAASEGVGQGAKFRVVLPLDADLLGRPADSIVRIPRATPIDRPREVEGLRVLVLDDEADARELLRALLEGCKVEVTTAASVAEAMKVVDLGTIDVVLSDIAMPEEDGLSFIRRVRALPREQGGRVPAVALTAYARLEDRTRALRSGFNAHVAKPVDLNELLAVLTSLMAK